MYIQDIISNLQGFWKSAGCTILQPHDSEMGAGTAHPATALRCLDANPWKIAYVQPCRRPGDGRYGENPNRTQHYFQFQALLKPAPDNIQELCLESLYALNIKSSMHDLRFVRSDWANPTLGAWGLGWEIWCDGMEVVQFTYMQQLGGFDCFPVPAEITYGIERIAMYVQGKSDFWSLDWNEHGIKYGDLFQKSEQQHCLYNFEYTDSEMLKRSFLAYLSEVPLMLENELIYPAYDYCLKAMHLFNILEARRTFSVVERGAYIANIRNMVRECCRSWVSSTKAKHVLLKTEKTSDSTS